MNLELDTQHKLVRLLRVLETAVHVVGGNGGGWVVPMPQEEEEQQPE